MAAYLRRGREYARADLKAEDKSEGIGEGQWPMPLRLGIAAAVCSIIDQPSTFC